MNKGSKAKHPGKVNTLFLGCAIGLVLLFTSEPPVVSHGQEIASFTGMPTPYHHAYVKPKKEVYKLIDSARANTSVIISNDMTAKQYTEYIKQQALTIQQQNRKLDSLEFH